MKLYYALLALLFLAACTDPITVGSDLLNEDRAGVGESTDVSFTTRVLREDSLFVLNGTSSTEGSQYVLGPDFSFGQIDEPTFGRTTHSVYLTPRLIREAGATVIPQFARQITPSIDSVVLILPIDTFSAVYGPGRTFPYRALELADTASIFGRDIYSNFSAETLNEDLGYSSSFTVNFTPRPVRDTANFNSVASQPHVRIRLSDAFGERLDALQPDDYETETIFRQNFPGLYLTPNGDSEGLVNLYGNEPPVPPRTSPPVPYSGFNVYFTDSTGNPAYYRMPVQVAIPNYEYDYANALVEPLIGDGADDDLVAVAGKGGLMTEIEIGDLSQWEGSVINRAVLEIPVADVEGVSYEQYPRPARLELFYRPSSSGPLVAIQDKVELIRTRASPSNIDFFLGGNLRTEGDEAYYSVSFSLHMQRILDGEVPPRLYLRTYPLNQADYQQTSAGLFEPVSARDVGRVLLNGPQAAANPARIRLTYTTLD